MIDVESVEVVVPRRLRVRGSSMRGSSFIGGRLTLGKSRIVRLLDLLDRLLLRLSVEGRLSLNYNELAKMLRVAQEEVERLALLLVSLNVATAVSIRRGRARVLVLEATSYFEYPRIEMESIVRAAAVVRGLLLRGGPPTILLEHLAVGSEKLAAPKGGMNSFYRVLWERYADYVVKVWPCPIALCSGEGMGLLAHSRNVGRGGQLLTVYALSDLALPIVAAIISGLATAYAERGYIGPPPKLKYLSKGYRAFLEKLWGAPIATVVETLTTAYEVLKEGKRDEMLETIRAIGSKEAEVTVRVAVE